jgi:RNA polymerase sigma-70 factor (ECF subfamily)
MTAALVWSFAAVPPAEDDASRTWFAALAEGNREPLGTIYDRFAAELHALALWRTGSREDADDVVQEVFVRLATTGADHARVREPRGYLLAMAHRASVDRRRRPRTTSLDDVAFVEAPPFEPERAADAARASSALGKLPGAQREAVWLHHFAGLGFREIGDVTGVPTFTAASRYRLGLAKLRALLGETR